MKILIIDDDKNLLKVNRIQLEDFGYSVTTTEDGKSGVELFRNDDFDLVLCDVQMPKMNGKEVLKEIRKLNKETPFVIITAFGSTSDAMELVKLGANDYILKPFGVESLIFAIEKNISFSRLKNENTFLKKELKNKDFIEFVSVSQKCQKIKETIQKIKDSSATVLITGETGVGKEVVAKNIHFFGNRQNFPFVAVNCASIPETLIESELFGHKKGAFTGANEDRIGKFELANGGTIFLDEIGDLKHDLQAKLLRVLQDKQIEKIGSNKSVKIDVRVIAATHNNLEEKIRQNLFREDLYFRLNVIPINIPSLRERKEDILPLANFFLQKFSNGFFFGEKIKTELQKREWKGNVRELENIVERAVLLSNEKEISSLFVEAETLANENFPVELGLEALEKMAVSQALEKCNGNQTQAAKLLKIERHVLLYKIKKFKI
ncbi:sigma-54-dependent Fis family transcriptional regulator [bacterium]|nr:sigma-54-dependent Fis family transcriptional regulator [bacterium]